MANQNVKENNTMMTDKYEFRMGKGYFDSEFKDTIVYFDVFFRKNILNSGYTISGGLKSIIDHILNFKFEDDDIEFLRSIGGFSEEYLSSLKEMGFTGDIYAVPDGTPVFPNEPVMTIRANVIEAQLIETALLSLFNHQTLITTATKRITEAAKPYPVVEFGTRRGAGYSANEASRCAYIAGCTGTSNMKCGKENNIPTMGTMAHSFISLFPTEYEAFLRYAKSNPEDCTFLVDTYNTLKSGIPNAIRVAKEFLIPNGYEFKGIRIDSGDLAYLSNKAREMLDEAGFPDAGICLSNSLDETTIRSLIEQKAAVDNFGVGDNAAAPLARGNGVYKLVAMEQDGKIIPKIKVSEEDIKTIIPGYKKVYRFYDKQTNFALGDVIALAHETIPEDSYTLISPTYEWKKTELSNYYVKELQVPIFLNGELVYNVPSAQESREYCEKEFATLYPEIKRQHNPHGYYVDLSEELLKLKKDMTFAYRKMQ